MAKSPFSTAGGGNADTSPHSYAARARGGRVDIAESDSSTVKAAKSKSTKPPFARACGGSTKGKK
jgi:hypothetical protein